MSSNGYGRCCNPFSLENHRKNKSLRQASKYLQEKWGLTKQDYLCDRCRKRLASGGTVSKQNNVTINGDDMIGNIELFDYVNVDEIDNEISPISSATSASQASTEMFLQVNNLSQSSIDQLLVINQALTLLNVSPIPTRMLTDQLYLNGKVGEVCRTLRGLLKIGDDFPTEINGRSTRDKTS